ncbi:hypothetical protein [Thiohalophilus sp.]|uniref:hypothetical protein n=1 Tax=Thiohalophilus sp. TaxID=3028392 RepID=UPI002ACE8A34|nr:hypothetical protein [Thiohalophilus sp.]MDZ7804378.1 hypothetical protein [Thiohalophilus sp.]
MLIALGEMPGLAADNLDLAERWGLIPSANDWLTIRKLRNQMVHEYIEDPQILVSALQSGHDYVSTLLQTACEMAKTIDGRGWLE